MDIDQEINRLESALKMHHDVFLKKSMLICDRIDYLERCLNSRTAHSRRHTIMTKIDFYENELSKLHNAIEVISNDINNKIKLLRESKDIQEKEKQKRESIDYNLECLRMAINRRDTREIYTMFETVLNSIVILKNQLNKNITE